MTPKRSFGQWLKQHRKALDLTREELSQRVGCAVITLYKIEADERRPSKQIAALFAEYLNIPPNERNAFVRFARGEATEYFAPWGTPFHPPTNLPTQPTPLIGREEESAAICKRLLQPEARLLTLIGPPGIGKTRLALKVASEVLDNFTDGVFFVALAPIRDASFVLKTIVTTLDLQEVGPQTPLQRLKTFLREKQTLLVLDNFEQILEAAAQIAELLTACPSLKVLVTSRAPLRIRQERQWPVPALALPDLTHLTNVEFISHYSAITLFLERAQAVKPDFSLTQENAPLIAAICTRLDGLPLAIELISARVKLLSLSALLERLHGRLMLQSDGLRDIEPRHRTLNAAIDWSYQMLSAGEQTLFRRLAIFVGGWTIEAAEAVCSEGIEMILIDGLASLLDKNLVKQETRPDGERRFMMLETILEYAREKLVANSEENSLRTRHANYFLDFAEHSSNSSTDETSWLNNLELELDNFRAAFAWARLNNETNFMLRLPVALCRIWQQRGRQQEGRDMLTEAITRQKPNTDTDRLLRAQALSWLGLFNIFTNNSHAANRQYEEMITIYRELGDEVGIAEGMSDYGMSFHMMGDYQKATKTIETAIDLCQRLNLEFTVMQSLFFLGTVNYSEGNIERAEALFNESLNGFRTFGTEWMIADLLNHIAMIKIDQGNYALAHQNVTEGLGILWKRKEKWSLFRSLEIFAFLAAAEGEPHLIRSARIFGAVEKLRETFGVLRLPMHDDNYRRGVARLQAQLDVNAIAKEWTVGREMTLEQTVAYALDDSAL